MDLDMDVPPTGSERAPSAMQSAARPTANRRRPACQLCRRRKVRCDNARPTCGFCRHNNVSCEYITRSEDGKGDLKQVFDRLDGLSQAVENIQQLLTANSGLPRRGLSARSVAESELTPVDTPQPTWPSGLTPQGRQGSGPTRAAEPHKDYLQIPACRGSCDTVLTWPVFLGRFRESSLITTLFQSSHGSVEGRPMETWNVPDGFRSTPDEQIPFLVDRFIQNVHTKNPIVDLETLIRTGRHAAEFGLQWDAQSCLVLLACALGCISQPFTYSMQGPHPEVSLHEGLGRQSFATSSSAPGLREGETFFVMACRRIGLLRYSVVGAQCHFFAGVYLMYTFRPLSAWNHFYQAATFYRLRLRMIDGLDTSAYETEQQGAPVTERLEQSLYWSCFKSEVEIRVELPLPQSAIAEYEYPALFPTPPTLSDVYPENDYQGQGWTSTQTPSRSAEDSQANNRRHPLFGRAGVDVRNHILKLFDEEQSWYYYLTEVALRRIGNRVQNAFYRGEPSSWSNIKPLIPIALEFESQIHAWSANLPATMQYYANEAASGHARQGASSSDTQDSISLELSWAIGNRFLEIRLWLYQPFLYFAAHYPIEATASPVTETASLALTPEEARTVRGLVQSGLDCSMKILDARCLRHRHHGIWFDLRALVTASLIFIALAKGGNIDLPGIDSPGGIRSRLDRTLEALDYWEDEAPDIKKARRVLEDLIRETS